MAIGGGSGTTVVGPLGSRLERVAAGTAPAADVWEQAVGVARASRGPVEVIAVGVYTSVRLRVSSLVS